ncbi:tetratricopeptide repeat protein [Muricoccus radiodurans]|uniref:tetratricopeptide repeat protein n=1 Tax=Muricoccus radiodurans TaxID=2231721 RepID=UPI003CE9CBBC
MRVATIPGDDGTLVITFPSYDREARRDGPAFAERLLRRHGLSAIHVTVGWSHWFQVPETDAALAAIRAVARSFRRVVTYGSSMGGYAAAACSRGVGAHAILALCPQISVDRAKVPWEPHWAEAAARIAATTGFGRDDMASNLARDAALHLVFDPRMRDARHAAPLLALSARPRPLLLPFSGHSVGEFLRDAGALRGYVLSVLRGEGGAEAAARRAVRPWRRGSATWWMNLSLRAQRRPALAVAAARRALELAPENEHALRALGDAHRAAGDAAQAARLYAGLVTRAPRNGLYRLLLADSLLRTGHVSQAAKAYAAAAGLRPDDHRPQIGLCAALAIAGKTASARAALERAKVLGAPREVLRRAGEGLSPAVPGRAAAG